MTKDNSTGKNKEFYDLGKKMFDRLNPQIAFNPKVVGYVAPQREWVGLTDDELLKTYGWQFESYGQSDRPSSLGQSIVDEAKQEIIDGLRKVEAALKEKNI